MFISHQLLKENTIEERDYQRNILNTAVKKNTLAVLPTGVGKTILSVLLAVNRLEKFPESKILMLAPTKPLASQHEKFFKKSLDIEEDEIILLTGQIPANKRKDFYEKAKIILATPQTLENDIKSNIINLKNYSLLVIDECHRCVKNYAYTYVTKKYKEQSENPLILALTASPGSTEEKIKEICENLFIDAVEIKSDIDKDVQPYIKPVEILTEKVELTEDIKKIQGNLKEALEKRKEALKKYNIIIYSKKNLLDKQKQISRKIGINPIYYRLISLTAEAIKIWHALELLETQSISSLKKYLDRMDKKKVSVKRIFNDENIINAVSLLETVKEHPKMSKLKEIVENEKTKKIIVFSHYRDNIEKIYDVLKEVCKPVILIGQREGLTQKEQIEIIKNYERGDYNCLIASPIGEEGLHLASADIAIFYDSVPSEIRTIQRRGRVGRVKIGKIIFLLTKKTRDEAYFYTSIRKETRMKSILKNIQKHGLKKRNLKDFV